jgi:hypothetical protein
MKNSTSPLFFLHQTLQSALCIRLVTFSWHPPNPYLSVCLLDTVAWFITPENVFPLLQSPMAARFTPLQPTLGISHGDLKLVCGCSALETHFMKLPSNCYCVDVASRCSLDSVVSVATEGRRFLRPTRFSTAQFCELVWPYTSWLSHCCF